MGAGQTFALSRRTLRVQPDEQVPEISAGFLLLTQAGHWQGALFRVSVLLGTVLGDGCGSRSRKEVRWETFSQRYENVESVAADDGRRLTVDADAAGGAASGRVVCLLLLLLRSGYS